MNQSEQLRGADRRKHHVIYKTTCLVTSKYYIGMHSTDDLADGYIGSGKRLWQSLRKHGIEQHHCEVLEHLPSREALRVREAELVDSLLLEDKLCMNIALGGHGSWDHVNLPIWQGKSNRKRSDVQRKVSAIHHARLKHDEQYADQFKQCVSVGLRQRFAAHPHNWVGKTHSDEVKKLLSEQAKARTANSSTGNPWVYHEDLKQSKKVKADQLESYLQQGWLKGRKLKFMDR